MAKSNDSKRGSGAKPGAGSSAGAAGRRQARPRARAAQGKRRKARGRESSTGFGAGLAGLRSWPLGYLTLLALGALVWWRFVGGDQARVSDLAAADSGPRLASFRHAGTLSADEVDDLRRAYIATYATDARREMRAHGIPASITLAQGLLESVAGTSRLAAETNNHFGIKCFARACPKGHCRNFEDDHHKDFFRRYDHPAESFRAHSGLLTANPRYAPLFDLDRRDYRAWAKGLREAGYATDPRYAAKLISLIERYGLDRFDES